jgi:hypothetical protein
MPLSPFPDLDFTKEKKSNILVFVLLNSKRLLAQNYDKKSEKGFDKKISGAKK